MNDSVGYSVYFFEPALEALGDAVKPYLEDGPAGPHVPCRVVDTGGGFIEMTLEGTNSKGQQVEVELIVPANMVRVIVSARSDAEFGFQVRRRATPVMEPELPPVADAAPSGQVEGLEAAAPDRDAATPGG